MVIPSVRLIVHGRVQGVGFRHFVRLTAVSLAIAGWVRNRPDGTVEVEASGERPGLDRLVTAVSQGPAGARVTEVEQAWSERKPGPRGFHVAG
jgi:acylphosphatase